MPVTYPMWNVTLNLTVLYVNFQIQKKFDSAAEMHKTLILP